MPCCRRTRGSGGRSASTSAAPRSPPARPGWSTGRAGASAGRPTTPTGSSRCGACSTRRPGCRPWSTTTPTPPPGRRRATAPAPVFDPELVVIGGGLVHTGDLLLEPARASMERYTFGLVYRELPPVVPARLGSDAGMVGAATLALRAGG